MTEYNEKPWAVQPSQIEAVNWRGLQKTLGKKHDITGEFIEATKSEVLREAMKTLVMLKNKKTVGVIDTGKLLDGLSIFKKE